MRARLKIFLIILAGLVLAATPAAFAYKLQIQFPGAPEEITSPAVYVQVVYSFALMIVGLVALGVLVFAGIEYMISPGSETYKKDALERIQQALWGLGLLLAAYLILYTINPDLVKLKFSLKGGGATTAQQTTQRAGGQTTTPKDEREAGGGTYTPGLTEEERLLYTE